jgi:hypothetical protein
VGKSLLAAQLPYLPDEAAVLSPKDHNERRGEK